MKNLLINFQSIQRRTLLAIAAGITFLAFLIGSAAPVYAQTDPGTSPTAPTAAPNKTERLQNAYKREQTALTTQQGNLDKSRKAVTKAQSLIDKAKSNGKDVTALQTALNTFNSQIASAQILHDTAAATLGKHDGFDASGNVTDPALAKNTVLTAHDSLQDARLTMRQAVLDLQKAVRDWRRENRTTKSTPVAPTAAPTSSSGL
jgi:hypothetical protein